MAERPVAAVCAMAVILLAGCGGGSTATVGSTDKRPSSAAEGRKSTTPGTPPVAQWKGRSVAGFRYVYDPVVVRYGTGYAAYFRLNRALPAASGQEPTSEIRVDERAGGSGLMRFAAKTPCYFEDLDLVAGAIVQDKKVGDAVVARLRLSGGGLLSSHVRLRRALTTERKVGRVVDIDDRTPYLKLLGCKD